MSPADLPADLPAASPDPSVASSLARIAAALDRLAPPPLAADPAAGHWFALSAAGLAAVPAPRVTPLALYAGVDAQKAALAENARRHALGLPAHDVLLWGARGMGKSSLVRAIHADLVAAGHDVALVQVAGDPGDAATLAGLFARLAPIARRFTVFLDDVGLTRDGEVHALRSLLDGGILARPDHVRLVVTSNRRNLTLQDMRGRDTAEADPVNPRDAMDDALALADRFGLRLGFHACDQDQYLAMCAGYAAAHGLAFDPQAALTYAAGRGARSGRVAWHFTVETAGTAGRALLSTAGQQ